jgi:hypothetical protein
MPKQNLTGLKRTILGLKPIPQKIARALYMTQQLTKIVPFEMGYSTFFMVELLTNSATLRYIYSTNLSLAFAMGQRSKGSFLERF